VTPNEEQARQIIKDAVSAYINIGFQTMFAGMRDTSICYPAIEEMRSLHLAEPHLPAGTAVEKLKEAGLLR
jgi:hypothetical protein